MKIVQQMRTTKMEYSDRRQTLLIIVFLAEFNGLILSQSKNAIRAHRTFKETSFSCIGRPAGYYADVETSCQVYHMCDGLGRQFSYSCPNTTLFQQRMLICDHWYMVNCSKSENDYAVNLLIGQRDKPFVPDEENHLRTPRPDLLDRPYAPDYSGESFRNQYKQEQHIENEIFDTNNRKEIGRTPTGTHWSFQQPSKIIQPPASLIDENLNHRKLSVTSKPAFKEGTLNSLLRRMSSERPPHQVLNQRIDESDDDLGTSFSSNYNSSADVSLEHQNPSIPISKAQHILSQSVKAPSRVYEPPVRNPVYNKQMREEITPPLVTSTAAPFSVPFRKVTTQPPFSKPTTLSSGRPFASSTGSSMSTIANISGPSRVTQRNEYAISHRTNKEESLKHSHGFRKTLESTKDKENVRAVAEKTLKDTEATHDFNVDNKLHTNPVQLHNSDIVEPSKELRTPFQEFILHDVATTQGPPIYYEWKIPSNGLEPPKLDSPIRVDVRQEEDISTPSVSKKTSKFTFSSSGSFSPNPFTSKNQRSIVESSTTRSQTSRSIKYNSPEQNSHHKKSNKSIAVVGKPINSTLSPSEVDIRQWRKDLLIPDFLFPLELNGRTGYEHTDTRNSFQLKIPNRRSDGDKSWYGENPQCPECHPTYVKPGTCEPCLKHRR